jgi:ketosteroid isomerase-like protein
MTMRRTGWVSTAVIAVGIVAAGAAVAGRASSKFDAPKDVRDLIKLEETMQTTPSADDLMPHLARNATMADLMVPAWYPSWEKIYDNMDAQLAHAKAIKLSMQDVQVATDGQIGCLAMNVHSEDETTEKAKAINITFRQLDIFRKTRGGNWLLSFTHAYWPVDPNTGRFLDKPEFPLRGAMKRAANPLPGPVVAVDKAEQELRQWLESRIVASTPDTVMSHFGPSDDVVAYDPYFPGEHIGLQEVRSHFAAALMNVRAIDAQITDYRSVTDGEMGGIISRQNLQLHMRDGGIRNLSVRQSTCLRRVGSKWYAIMEQTTFPVDVKTGWPVTSLAR